MQSSNQKLAFSVEDAAEVAGISRATLYKELKAQRVKSFTVGTRRLISLTALSDYIRNRESETAQTEAA